MELEDTMRKWYLAKKELEKCDNEIKRCKKIITSELNKRGTDTLSAGNYSVSRRRNSRTYLTKESIPSSIWEQYATRCNYDSYHLVRK